MAGLKFTSKTDRQVGVMATQDRLIDARAVWDRNPVVCQLRSDLLAFALSRLSVITHLVAVLDFFPSARVAKS